MENHRDQRWHAGPDRCSLAPEAVRGRRERPL